MMNYVIPEGVQQSFAQFVAVMQTIANLLLALPGFCTMAYHWSVNSVIWCLFAIAFAFAQRLFMLLRGVWRPLT